MSPLPVTYPPPRTGSSLLLAVRPVGKTCLIIGANGLAASRAFAALEADATVIVAASCPLSGACAEIIWRATQKQIQFVDLGDPPNASEENAISGILDENGSVAMVCVTDTLLDANTKRRRSLSSATDIYHRCRSRNIPINVTDMPTLCDFTFPSTHRFASQATKEPTSLQIAITTNGKGCRLAGRIKRDLIAKLHPGYGDAVENIGQLRLFAKESGVQPPQDTQEIIDLTQDDVGHAAPLNLPVRQLSRDVQEEPVEQANRRMRWVAQVSEYWSVDQLAGLQEVDMHRILETESSQEVSPAPIHKLTENEDSRAESDASRHALSLPPPPRGQIFLVGSGPGHPSMLTVAARKALTELGTLILSDKLVPAEILALIPPHIPLYIAKKFPGNAEGAQSELMEMATDAAKKGEIVVRLKQGDPFVYGRGGEEVVYFRKHGFESIVIPGVSSSLAGPSFVGIPVTQRGVAESLTICTGVGRKGRSVQLPAYERSRTLIILMGVARLPHILAALMKPSSDPDTKGERWTTYPPYLPIAIVERASSPDQRLVASTLENIEDFLERSGEQRPPGMIVVGWSVLALEREGDLTVLDDAIIKGGEEGEVRVAVDPQTLEVRDRERIGRWLAEGTGGGILRDGLGPQWNQFL